MSPAFFGSFILFFFLLLIGLLILAIFFNLTMQRSMAAVSKKNQTIVPGLIWLNFIPIPILNTVWTMIFGIMTCKAMNKEAGKNIAPTKLAIIYPSLSLLISVLSFLSGLVMRSSRDTEEIFSLLIMLISITTLVLWIIFWVQLNNAKKELQGKSGSSTDGETLDSGFVDGEL